MQPRQITTKNQLNVTIRLAMQADILANRSWWDIGDFTEVTDMALAGYLEPGTGLGEMCMAEIDAKMVGCVWVDVYERPRQGRPTGIIHDLRVLKDLTGQGIGDQLVDFAEAYILSRGLEWAEVGSDVDNARLRAYYTKRGYFAGAAAAHEKMQALEENTGSQYNHTYVLYKRLCKGEPDDAEERGYVYGSQISFDAIASSLVDGQVQNHDLNYFGRHFLR